MDKQIYWFITVFEKAEIDKLGWPKTGTTRCWGFYKNKEDALDILHNNITDLWETCYDYAVLEPYYEGISGYNFDEPHQYFKYDKERNGYFEIDTPYRYGAVIGFSLG